LFIKGIGLRPGEIKEKNKNFFNFAKACPYCSCVRKQQPETGGKEYVYRKR
jgi:hypothetical protein